MQATLLVYMIILRNGLVSEFMNFSVYRKFPKSLSEIMDFINRGSEGNVQVKRPDLNHGFNKSWI